MLFRSELAAQSVGAKLRTKRRGPFKHHVGNDQRIESRARLLEMAAHFRISFVPVRKECDRIAIERIAALNHVDARRDDRGRAHIDRKTEAVEQLGPEFAFFGIAAANEHETRGMANAHPFTLDQVLAGGGPQDVIDITIELAREMLRLAGVGDVDVAAALADGRAMDKWRQMVAAQGGNADAPMPVARESHVVTATASGVLTQLDALAVGVASWRLGAGRERKEDAVQLGAGITLHAQQGQRVTAGQPLMTLFTDEPARFDRALASLEGGITIDAAASESQKTIVLDRVTA